MTQTNFKNLYSYDNNITPDFNHIILNILHKMIDVVYDYAQNIPAEAFLYIQLQNDGKISMDTLYDIQDNFYHAYDIDKANMNNVDFDVSEEHQKEMYGKLINLLINGFIHNFEVYKKFLPREIWIRKEITTHDFHVSFSYGNNELPHISEGMNSWKHVLMNPDEDLNNFFHNFPYISVNLDVEREII